MMTNEETIITTNNLEQEHEQPTYDVFISFNRSDSRLSFAGNLFNTLRRKRFKTFMDIDGIKSGNQVVPSIYKALKGSRVLIVILSENYAISTYCLDELVAILECRHRINQPVLPIFYDVEQSGVRTLGELYDRDFGSHLDRFEEDLTKLQKWKSALWEITNIEGLLFGERHQRTCQYELIQNTVKWISNTLCRYDVFLSFNEQDTRYSFSSYLYNALDQEGFKVLMKDTPYKEEVEDQSSKSLVTAITKSRISIIVLSKNYAYSTSCLDELVTILDFMKNNQILVWPVFYKVEPSEIRHQRNSYKTAMDEHENNFGKDSQKVKIWRSALFEISNLKGWHLKYGYEYKLIEKIVETAIKM